MTFNRAFIEWLAIVLVCAGCRIEQPYDRPIFLPPTRGVVLISVDTLRADHLGAYGYRRATSPFIDELAGRAVVFDNAIVQYPSTLTSHMSIFTGLYPQEHGVFPPDSVLSPSIGTIPQVLLDSGFRTAGHTEGGFVAGRFGFDRGFETYTEPDGSADVDVDLVVDRGLRFLSSLTPLDRFFLFLHTYAVHDPYEPPERYRSLFFAGQRPANVDSSGARLRRFNRGVETIDPATVGYFETQYDASIRWVDDAVQRLFAGLAKIDLNADTTVIITSDHGEEFLEHGRLAHTQVYPECVRVPLLIIHPAMSERRQIDDLVESVDLAPTILSLLGLPQWDQPSGSNLLAPRSSDQEVTTAFSEVIEKEHVRSLMRRDRRGRYQLLTAAAPRDPDGTWVSRTATFTVDTSVLDLKVQSFAVPRKLEITIDGRLARTVTIPPSWREVKIDLVGPTAGHRVSLATDGCVSPRELGVSADGRCLGIQIAGPELRWFELFNLGEDPEAKVDIAPLENLERRDLWELLAKRRWLPRARPSRRPLTADEQRALEALGYLDPAS